MKEVFQPSSSISGSTPLQNISHRVYSKTKIILNKITSEEKALYEKQFLSAFFAFTNASVFKFRLLCFSLDDKQRLLPILFVKMMDKNYRVLELITSYVKQNILWLIIKVLSKVIIRRLTLRLVLTMLVTVHWTKAPIIEEVNNLNTTSVTNTTDKSISREHTE